MDAEPRITDDEIASFINSEEIRELDRLNDEVYTQEAQDIVWSAIEHLDLPVVACRDEKDDDEAIDRLTRTILSDPATEHLFDATKSPDENYNHALEIAEDYFEQELLVIERLAVCIEEQLRNPQDIGMHTTIKKQFMADLIVERSDTPLWYRLCDETLQGDMIDVERDAEIIVATIGEYAYQEDDELDTHLYNKLNQLFGIPDGFNSHTTTYTEQERLEFLQLSNLTTYLQAILKAHARPEAHPERDQLIDTAFREWGIKPAAETRAALLDIADTL